MKRIITVTVFFLFLASVAVFVAFGPQIRAALSPRIRYAYPVMEDVDGQFLNAIPASALWTGEDGGSYVWRISRSDEFPEPAFVVGACPVEIVSEKGGKAYFSYGQLSTSDAVAVEWDTGLREGMCVRPER